MSSAEHSSLLTVIGGEAFYGCKMLKAVPFPDAVEEIGRYAFSESGLESVATPQSVRIIRQGAFCKCDSLRTATLNEGLETLGTDEYMYVKGYDRHTAQEYEKGYVAGYDDAHNDKYGYDEDASSYYVKGYEDGYRRSKLDTCFGNRYDN